MPRNDRAPRAIKLDEKNHVEEPFLKQLEELKWEVLRLDMKAQKPEDSFRDLFIDVVMLPKLREALSRINPWMDDDQIEEAVRRITTPAGGDLLENNQRVLKLLLEGASVAENRRTGERSPTVHYVDFERRENNSFIAVSQFKVRIPGADRHIIPDITLFLNGLPVAVIECKSPKVKDAISEAIDQMLRYSEQRGDRGEGNQALFHFNQLLIATCRQESKFGTITAHSEKHFHKWLDPFPRTLNDLEHQGTTPNDQQRLVAGILDHDNLLSIIRTFTLFSVNDKGQTIKVVGRYQQFRAVKKAVNRLRDGRNKRDRSGIIWHTQGSGKSLTMMFMVREMYRYTELTNWKVVYITDRTQLEKQLSETTQAIGMTVKVANSIPDLKNLLRGSSSDLVMGMIHKFQERDLEETFPELNLSQRILVMTDEAHRSQFVVNPKNETKSLVGVFVKVRSFSGLLGAPTHEFIAFGQETIFDCVGTGSAL